MHTTTTEVSNMARINLSIPDDLKQQMDEVDLNWSSLAAEAFKHAVDIHNLKGKNMTTEAGIARLQESKQKNYDREYAEGFNQGQNWALNSADYEQLKAVADLRVTRDELTNNITSAEWDAPNEIHGVMYREFGLTLEELFRTKTPSEGVADGFIDGAGEVFDEV